MENLRRFFGACVLRSMVVWASIAVLLGAGGCANRPERNEQAKPLRVLFIGNSYTYVNMLPEMIRQLSLAGRQSRSLEYRMIAPGGWSLEQHWNRDLEKKAIAEGGWDYVVLQEQSLRPLTNSAKLFEYARLFGGEIKKSGAKSVFYATWARKSTPERQPIITANYASIAAELGGLCSPAGPAWSRVIKERPDLELFQSDGSHPSPAGTYLSACVFYSVLYGEKPYGLPENITGKNQEGKAASLAVLSVEDARFLQKTAWRIVREWRGGKQAPKQ